MVATPILEELGGSAYGRMIDQVAGTTPGDASPSHDEQIARQPTRRLSIYPASAGFELVEELDFLAARAIEPNIFFNPRFLAPAMPRLEDRDVRLAVIRDGDEDRSRLRLLVPFTIEKGSLASTSHLRTWANPFAPLGTPLVDRDDPTGIVADFFDILARPHLNLPKVFVMPEVRLDGPFAAMVRALSDSRNLPVATANRFERAFLHSDLEGEDYLRGTLSTKHLKEFRRLKRKLEEQGTLEYSVSRHPDDVRPAVEAYLALESGGWKGRTNSAMALDRFQGAFAREATQRLSEKDMCRIHTLSLDGTPIAVLIIFIEHGVAYTWKTAYDEQFSPYSPGMLLMIEATHSHLEDPNIEITDSCAVPDHPVVNRLWAERRTFCTLVIGLTPDAERQTRQIAQELQRAEQVRSVARGLRDRVKKALKR
jgi:hypothetical protein